jgi:hypothetical protein
MDKDLKRTDQTPAAPLAWQANSEKVAFVKEFPGRLSSWPEFEGKTVERVMASGDRPWAVLLFADGTFAVVPKMDEVNPDPAELLSGIQTARPHRQEAHREAYTRLDALIAQEKKARREARLQNILGAIRNNLSEIPELKEELAKLLEALSSEKGPG